MCLSCTIEEVTGVDLGTDAGHDELDRIKAENGGRIPWPPVTAEMKEVAGYIHALYEIPDGGTGGPLHIFTDDDNVEDSNLAFCRKEVQKWSEGQHYADDPKAAVRIALLGGWILDLAEKMTLPERAVAVSLGHGILAEMHGRVYMPATEFPIREEVLDDDGRVVGMQWGFRHRTVQGGLG